MPKQYSWPHHTPEMAEELQNTVNFIDELEEWSLFLHVRARVIDKFLAKGKSAAMIADLLSMDPTQVELIGNRNKEEGPILPRKK